ncbi:MAG: AAA family ATPase [Deltaproteobacteria bacterium]
MAAKSEIPRRHWIKSIEFKGGFMDGTRLEFGPSLNCIIGGRGTGKTTILEALRWGLDQMPAVDRARARRQAVEELIRANVGNGSVHIEIETEGGTIYHVSRVVGQAPMVKTLSGETINVELSRGNIFAADVYSQNEVEDIARDSLLQLALLDRTIDTDIKTAEEELAAVVKSLNTNAESIVRLRTEIADQRELIRDLPAVEERIREFLASVDAKEETGVGAAHEENAAREEEKHALMRLRTAATELESGLKMLELVVQRQEEQLREQAAPAGPNAETVAAGVEILRTLLKKVAKALSGGRSATDAAIGELDALSTKLIELHSAQGQKYQALLDEFRAERTRGQERARLEKQRAELLAKKQVLEQASGKLETALEERRALRTQLSEIRDQRYALRQAVARRLDEALRPMVGVAIEQFGNPEEYQVLLTRAMKGSGIKYNALVDRIVESIPPSALATIVQTDDKTGLAAQLDCDEERAMRVIMQLKDRPELYAIEVVELHDQPMLRLQDGKQYKESASLSTGQKCTIILPILLQEAKRPLLVDQPEDDLDNAFVFDAIVPSIVTVARARQLIFATHNPNIPVLGDAERVFVLESTGDHATVARSGGVDDVSGEIMRILEGGREAFEARRTRYGKPIPRR